MHVQLEMLVGYALQLAATDIHMILKDGKLSISMRCQQGYVPLRQDIFDARLLEYLKFVSGLDLTRKWQPQSGAFSLPLKNSFLSCRFSIIASPTICTAVLRLLNTRKNLKIADLTSSVQSQKRLMDFCSLEHGLVICAGPTGSGKTTTLHALLHDIAQNSNRKVISLEDPIEIPDELFVQLAVNEAAGFDYEKGIEELMRHDPDVILIGECRNAKTAKAILQASLTGHLVFCTLHAGNGREIISRMLEFGIARQDLAQVLQGMFAMRLLRTESKKECVYELWNRYEIEEYFNKGDSSVLSMEQILKARTTLEFSNAESYQTGAGKLHHALSGGY